MEGCFARLSHTQAEAVARRPNGLQYSRQLSLGPLSVLERPLSGSSIMLLSTLPPGTTILSCYSSHSSLLSLYRPSLTSRILTRVSPSILTPTQVKASAAVGAALGPYEPWHCPELPDWG